MTIRAGQTGSRAALRAFRAERDPGEACASCRFFDESRGTDLAVCRRHKIRTSIAARCADYDGKRGPRES